MTTFVYYRTLWRGALRKTIAVPSGLYLLPFSSWFESSPATHICVPELPKSLCYAVDSGAYRYRNGNYPYQPQDYMAWCQALDPPPLWVVMPDWFGHVPGVGSFCWTMHGDLYGPHPESSEVQEQRSYLLFLADLLATLSGQRSKTAVMQLRTSLMAYLLWKHFRAGVPSTWIPVIQGGSTLQSYLWHARLLLPLIQEMQAYYGPDSVFRVGVGALAGRPASELVAILTALGALLPPGIKVHLFAISLRDLELCSASLPTSFAELSIDTSQWTGQRIRGHVPGRKAWQESGLRQLAYGYTIALPAYEEKLAVAWANLQLLPPLAAPVVPDDSSVEAFLSLFLDFCQFASLQTDPNTLVAL